MENKDKTPRNDRGEMHGYIEMYHYKTKQISIRGYSHNGDDIGYNEYHNAKVAYYNIQ